MIWDSKVTVRLRRFASAVGIAWLLLLVGILGAVGAAWVAGLRLESVNSASMGPAIPKNSLALIEPMSTWEIEPGEVIAFRLPTNRGVEVLHRVVGSSRQPDGLFFKTRGDANNATDPLLVPDDDVVGRLRWHVPHLGAVIRMLQPPVGYVVLLGGPGLVLVAHEVVRRRRRRTSWLACKRQGMT